MMNPTTSEWVNLILRWLHVVAGVMWIGHLYFFNFVNAQVAKTYDADSKKKVVPELMPRALYWFRWGAAWTWLTGVLLLGVIYYMGGALVEPTSPMTPATGTIVGLGVIVLGFVVYDVLANSPLKQNLVAFAVLGIVLVTGLAWVLSQWFSARAVYIHVAATFGTIMAANVWMRIWPGQRKIIAAIKAGQAPDAAVVATAGLRSKQNTYMSVPLLLLMVSNHYPTIYGDRLAWLYLAGFVSVGFLIAMFLYKKSGEAAPAKF
jgi:uncharacterized membrane protein